jgi:hypothetical protein
MKAKRQCYSARDRVKEPRLSAAQCEQKTSWALAPIFFPQAIGIELN